jgi:hypothetical protein
MIIGGITWVGLWSKAGYWPTPETPSVILLLPRERCSIQPWNHGVRVFDQIGSEVVRVRVVGRGNDFFAWSKVGNLRKFNCERDWIGDKTDRDLFAKPVVKY